MPVIVLISTALTEGVKNMLSALRQEKYREEGKTEGREEGITEGREEGITETFELFKQAGVDEKTVNQVIELARASGIRIGQSNIHSDTTAKSNSK